MPTKNEFGLYDEEIDGTLYSFEKWGAEDALDVLIDIAKVAGKPLGMLLSAVAEGDDVGAKKGLLDKEVAHVLPQVFESLTQNMDKDTCKRLIKKLSSEKVQANGAKITFSTYYQDKLPLMFKVAKAALEVQYGNFFDAVKGFVPKPMPKQQPISNAGM